MRKKLCKAWYLSWVIHSLSIYNWLWRKLSWILVWLLIWQIALHTRNKSHGLSVQIKFHVYFLLEQALKKLWNQSNSRWTYWKISFIIRFWWLSWLHQYGSFQVLYLSERQIKNSSKGNFQGNQREYQNSIHPQKAIILIIE